MMSQSTLRRYAPFLVVAAVQVLLVAVVPSRGPDTSSGGFATGGADASQFGGDVGFDEGASSSLENVGTGTAGDPGAVAGGAIPSGDAAPIAGAEAPTGAAAPAGGADGSGGGGGAAPAGGGATQPAPASIKGLGQGGVADGVNPSSPGKWPWSHPWLIEGDRSTCAPGGQLQDNILTTAPPCVPKFTGNNGGGTYRGVTDTEIIHVWWSPVPANEATQTALAQSDLGANSQQTKAALETYTAFFNKHYEFYGRKLKTIIVNGDCADSSDSACIRAQTRAMVQKHNPFVVTQFAFPEVHDELNRLGVISIGCWFCSDKFKNERRPFQWDLFTSSNRMGMNVADYWCKRMRGKNATLAGDAIMRTQKRKLGVVAPENDIQGQAARELVQHVSGGMCGSGSEKPVFQTYSANLDDPTRAQEQAGNIAVTMKRAGVTTVTCLCDLFIPVFITRAFDNQQYLPEHLLALQEGGDHEYLGRLYSPTQWANAFGPALRPKEIRFEDQDNTKAWRDIHGKQPTKDEQPYVTTVMMMYLKVLAYQLQWAGPNLTPYTFERGSIDAPQMGGWTNPEPWPGWKCCDPVTQMWKFGKGDYTAVEDSKQLYYDPRGISPIDGRPGTYVCIDNCKRYPLGKWTPGEPKQP
jgi:hypothetical protein